MRPNRSRAAAAMAIAMMAPALMGSLGPWQNFDQRILAAHNRERVDVGVAPLSWNPELVEAARAWAQHLAESGAFEHSPDEPGAAAQGENLWAGTKGYYQPESMVGLWVAERADFKPGVFPNNSRSGDIANVGHYTQLVWSRTTDVGCALARGDEEDILVCRYTGAGNVIGQRPV